MMDSALCAPALSYTRSSLRRSRVASVSAEDGEVRVLDGKLFLSLLTEGGAALRAAAVRINALNVFPVPDGDTGDNMAMTYEGGISALESADADSLGEIAGVFAHGALLRARGNSGVILSQFFGGIAEGLKGRKDASVVVWGAALEKGVKRAYAAVLHPTEGTILSVARESVTEVNHRVKKTSSLLAYCTELHRQMEKALERTPDVLPVLREAGVVDSGGAGLLTIVEGFCRALRGEKTEADAPRREETKTAAPTTLSAVDADFEMQYGYCTELLLQLQNSKGNPASFSLRDLQTYLAALGDSIVTFMEGTVVKLHVHTKEPEKVLAYCRRFGELLTVKIENMSLQLQHTETVPAQGASQEKTASPKIKKPVVVAAVVNGSGVEQLFRDLGADLFVRGGQSDNPSTEDFLHAYEQAEAEDIFVLPNNGNIILAAKQSAALYRGARIHVLDTRDVGAGYAAMSVLTSGETDPSALENAVQMAVSATETGMLSLAVRDVTLDGIAIRKGDYIGFSGKKMLLSHPSLHEAALTLAGRLLENTERFMLTVLCGKDTSPQDTDRLQKAVETAFPGREIYFARGEQAVYPYIMIAE